MELAPFPQVMKREAQQGPVAAGKVRSGPASRGPKPLVQSQGEAVAFGQRVWGQYERESQGKAPGDGEIFFKPEKMYSLMRRGSDGSPAPVRLLRLSWLLQQARRRAVLPRRQELPEEAFLSEAEVRALPRGHVGKLCECFGCVFEDDERADDADKPLRFFEAFAEFFEACGCVFFGDWPADKPLRIIAISYGWLTPEHPDPDGEQLARFAKLIEHERQSCPGGCRDVGWSVFSMICCLGLPVGYCCYVIPYYGQQCGETAQQLPSGEFGVFLE